MTKLALTRREIQGELKQMRRQHRTSYTLLVGDDAYEYRKCRWKGTVQSVNESSRTMAVMLEPLQRNLSRHSAEISLDYVAPQDLPLAVPGAVFYLTIYVEKKRATIQNSEQIRFRRMSAWTKSQLRKISEDAEGLLACIED